MDSKRFNPKNADKLMSKERTDKLQPHKLIEYLEVGEEDSIADLGVGPGLFAIPLAKMTNKPVYGVDVEPEMLKRLKENAEAENLDNIKMLESDLESINLPDESVTRVLNTFVIHEVGDINNAINEMKRILTPDGILLLVDWEAVETESGPPLEIRVPSEKMVRLLKEGGFKAELVYEGPENYAVKAVKS
ncbi:class I SAM-dependent methyltransferase [Virgibacillus sp. MSJ-26]|uniref:class I SAM-dependent methyltransferase n=1 Tax=Virgibacillus sp. MSJ-26 TaxID=2841522 RepID=UPI001C1016E6|nr:class I SAM-dependent methyltransferase [Virgibacillus sp. MSJ-26]MBU5465792.1 class I SAM-dependent methyltransferase [Virgibacillus sp. MSJ-26]